MVTKRERWGKINKEFGKTFTSIKIGKKKSHGKNRIGKKKQVKKSHGSLRSQQSCSEWETQIRPSRKF